MAIRIRLRDLLDARGMSQTELQHQSRLAYSTISELYHDKVQRIDRSTLDTLCRTLECDVGELIEYTSDDTRPLTKARQR